MDTDELVRKDRIYCKIISYRDDLKGLIWPKYFRNVPRVGDFIRSVSNKEAKVIKITYCQLFPDDTYVELEVI